MAISLPFANLMSTVATDPKPMLRIHAATSYGSMHGASSDWCFYPSQGIEKPMSCFLVIANSATNPRLD